MGIFYDNLDDNEKKRQQLFTDVENMETRISSIGQELPRPAGERNLLLTVLDILDRPRNAIVSGLAGKGFVKGLTGQEHTNVSDLMGDSVKNKALKAALGFVGDVVLDPLTYLTVGAAGAAKGAAGVGAKKFLKVAGQPIADITPMSNAIGKGIQKTGIPDFIGPVFNPNYVRRAATTPEELPVLQESVNILNDTLRKISGQSLDAVDDIKAKFAMINTPEAAEQASIILESPTYINSLKPTPKAQQKKVTVQVKPQQALEDILNPALPKVPNVQTIEEGVSFPEINNVAGVKPSVEIPGINVEQMGNFAKQADEVIEPIVKESPVIDVFTPQVMIKKLVSDTRAGKLNKAELSKVLAKLPEDQQKFLFDEIRKASMSKLPSNIRKEIINAQKPVSIENGISYSEDMLRGNQKLLQDEIKDTITGLAKYQRDAMKEAVKQGDIWNKVKENGGIKSYADGFLKEEYRSVPISLRNKNGLTMDEMASTLGMTSNELMEAITTKGRMKVPTLKEAKREAERLLQNDPDYLKNLSVLAKIEDMLDNLQPGQLTHELRNLLPKITKADDLLIPEVKATVSSLLSGDKGKKLMDTLKSMEGSKLTASIGEVSPIREMPSLPTPKGNNLKLGQSDAIVKFDKPPIEEVPLKDSTIPEMFQAAKKAGIKISPQSRAAAVVAKKLTEETAAKDIAAGVEFKELPNYIRHYYKAPPDKVQTILSDWQKKQSNMPGRLAGFQRERKLPTIAEAERLGLQPEKDVRVLTLLRELEGIQQRAVTGMYKEIEKLGDNVMRDIDNAPSGWKAIPGVPQLKGKAVHPELARHLERFRSTISTDDGIRTFMSALNDVQSIWKGFVTAPNPLFHVRNAIGNFYNNFLAGVVNPDVYRLASIAQKGGDEVFDIAGKKLTGKQILTLFRENGLQGTGMFKGETSSGFYRQAKDAFEPKKFGLVKTGRKVGDWVENNSKMAHFLDRMMKGDTAKEAAASARKYLFDYSELTNAERKIRNFVPFYTWTRKNMPLQLESIITQPGKMTAYNKLVENSRSANGVEEGDMPGWMKSELALSIGNNKHLLLDLPVTQLNMLAPGANMKNLLGMITPLVKIPIEQAMGKQIFSGKPIEKYPGATVPYGNIQLPAQLAYALSQLGAVPRTAAQIGSTFLDQQPSDSYMPSAPSQIPGLSNLIRGVDPEREKLLAASRRLTQLNDLKRYLEEVKGQDVPTLKELGYNTSSKGKGIFY
jgi:transcriptional regulator with XRE-family HTH domain